MSRLFKKNKITSRTTRLPDNRSKVFTYNSARSAQQASYQRGGEKSKQTSQPPAFQKKLHKAINYLIVALVLYGLAYLTVLHSDAQVKISGEKVYPRDKSSYEQEIDRQLRQSILYRNKITFNSSKLSDSIRQKFPEVNDLQISIPLFRHRPVIEVTLSRPAAKLVTRTNTYILDEEGRALFEEKYASSSIDTGSLLAINDDSGHDIKLGKPALTEQQIAFIREVIGQTKAKGLQPRSFALSSGGTAVDVRFEGLNYFVKFSFDTDPKQSSGAFIAVNNQLKRTGGTLPSQYVDLRIPEKAFVK